MYDKIEAYNQALAAYRGYNEYDDAFESAMDEFDDALYDSGYDYDDYDAIESALNNSDFAYQSAMIALEGSSTVSAGGGGIFGKIWGAIKRAWNAIKDKVTEWWGKLTSKFRSWSEKRRDKRKEKYTKQYNDLNDKLNKVSDYTSDDEKKRAKAVRDYLAIADNVASKIVSTSNKVVSSSSSIISNFGKILTKVYSNVAVEDKSKAYAKTAGDLATKLNNITDEFEGTARNWATASDSLRTKYNDISDAFNAIDGQQDLIIRASTAKLREAEKSVSIVRDTCRTNMALVDSIERASAAGTYKNTDTGTDAAAVAKSYKDATGEFNKLTGTLITAINNMLKLYTNFQSIGGNTMGIIT